MVNKQYREFVNREMQQYESRIIDILVKWTQDGPWEPYQLSVPYDKTFRQVISEMPIVDWKREWERKQVTEQKK